jgi:hypothetical protein
MLTTAFLDLVVVCGRDVEAEHHPALVVLGNVAMSHPPSAHRCADRYGAEAKPVTSTTDTLPARG